MRTTIGVSEGKYTSLPLRATTYAAPAARPSPALHQLTLPDKPSIAVLPFDDPTQEGDYFAVGMVDEIVTALARFSELFVTGSNSSLSYRGRERDVAEIGRQSQAREFWQACDKALDTGGALTAGADQIDTVRDAQQRAAGP